MVSSAGSTLVFLEREAFLSPSLAGFFIERESKGAELT